MNYTKPEIAVLGDASSVIQENNNQKPGGVGDGSQIAGPNPAYDLDE